VSRTGELAGTGTGRTATAPPQPSRVLTDAQLDALPTALPTALPAVLAPATGTAGAGTDSNRRPRSDRALVADPGSMSTDDRK
jgi:hypothetical protein